MPQILKNGKENFQQKVYRVTKTGTIDYQTFYNTYVEHDKEGRLNQLKSKYSLNKIGTYSTSCYITMETPRKYLNTLKQNLVKKHPCPKIIEGKTICGLSQLTIERIQDYVDDTHVDWWIYDETDSYQKIIESFVEVKKE